MKSLAFFILIWTAGWLSVAAAETVSTRVALLCAGGGETGKDLLMLTDARLGEEPRITLLDRREIERVLREQKLTLSGLVDTEQALELGKVLRAEVFVVLEMLPNEKTPLGLVAFDAQTGVRLHDVTLVAEDLAETARVVAQAVKSACEKRNRVSDPARSVCLVSVRNADLPRVMDSRCQAVGTLLERLLVRSEGLTVLERKRLEHVNRERALPTVPSGGPLTASLLTIDLEIGRGPQGKGLRATALVSDAAGKCVAESRVTVPDEDTAALASGLTAELLESLNATPPPPIGDRTAEARRFCREARILRGGIQWNAALAAAESAYALDPTSRANLRQLELALHVSAMHMVRGDSPDETAGAFGLASRSLDVRRESFALSSPPDKPVVEYRLGISGDDPGLETMCAASAEPIDHWPAEVRPAVRDFREKYHRHLVMRMTQLATDSGKDEKTFINFLWQWEPSLVANSASDSRECIADVTAIIGHWLDSWERLGNRPLSPVVSAHIHRPLRFFLLDSHQPRHYRFVPEDYESLWSTLESMRRHPVPLVQDYGTWGEIWLVRRLQRPGPAFDEFKALVRKHIEQPEVTPASQARQNHYLGMLDALRHLPLDDAQCRRERLDLLEFMLDRREMVRQVVDEAISAPVTDRGEAEKRLALINRVMAVLDGGAHDVPGAPGYVAATIRKRLNDGRQQIESAWPELAGSRKYSVPWTQVHLLLRKDNLNMDGLTGPVLYDDRLLVLGSPVSSPAGRTNECEALCVPLDGGAVRVFGKVERQFFSSHQAVCAGGGHYCVSGQQGIVALPLDGGKPRRIDETAGLPSNQVQSMAWLEDKLYLAIGDGGYLVRWEPRGGICEVLASSRGKARSSPFDDCAPYNISFITSDPKRHRLLFLVRFTVDDIDRKGSHGLWQYKPATREFKQILEADESAIHTCSGMPARGDELMLWFYTNWLIRVDLKTDAPSLIHGPAVPAPIPRLRSQRAPYQNFAGTGPPYVEMDGWLWSVRGGFARMSKNTGTIERLPSLETDSVVTTYSYLEPIGDGSRLLVGNDSAFWLVTLKDASNP